MRLYPNLTSSEITINKEQLAIKTIEVYDVIGQLMARQDHYNSNATIPLYQGGERIL